MSQLQIFNHPMFGDIRFVEINNNPHAVGNDVAKALGYSRPHEAISNHCKGAVTYRILTNGGEQTVKVIFFYNGWAQNSYTFRIGVLRPNLCNEALRLTVGTTGIV